MFGSAKVDSVEFSTNQIEFKPYEHVADYTIAAINIGSKLIDRRRPAGSFEMPSVIAISGFQSESDR